MFGRRVSDAACKSSCELSVSSAFSQISVLLSSSEPADSEAVDLISALFAVRLFLQYSSDYNVALWDLGGNRVSSTHNRVPTVCLI